MLVFWLACSGAQDNVTPDLKMGGAEGVLIEDVRVYQGPEVGAVPLLGGRDAVLRVAIASDRMGETFTVRLTSAGQEFDQEMTLADELLVPVPGDTIQTGLDFTVEVLEVDGDNADAVWSESFLVDEQGLDIKIVLVPFAYHADGSGRLPDLSEESLARLEDRAMQLYPAATVNIEVHEVIDWYAAIEPNGQGWQEVGFELFQLRSSENPDDDVYYYGVFNPRSSFASWCGQGCLNGVTLLNDDPADTGIAALRLALGTGFEDYFADTMLHELGHAMGREHADCGPGIDPSSIDRDYPYNNGGIGAEAVDLVNVSVVSDSYADIMSYCSDIWISDYTYMAVLDRGLAIRPDDGQADSATPTMSFEPVPGATFVPWDHLPGGVYITR